MYYVYLSDVATAEWYKLPCCFIPKQLIGMYGMLFEIRKDEHIMKSLLDDPIKRSFGWVIQTENGKIISDILELAADIKERISK
jgi:hypothetical protein